MTFNSLINGVNFLTMQLGSFLTPNQIESDIPPGETFYLLSSNTDFLLVDDAINLRWR